MSASPLHVLMQVTLVSSVVVLLIGALRKPLRVAVGARAAYWLWLAVPANALAVLLPAPSHAARGFTTLVLPYLTERFSNTLVSTPSLGTSMHLADPTLAVWVTGALLMAVRLVRRQRAFIQSLGHLTVDAAGVCRSKRITAPVLVGAWRPCVVVPVDFEVRYSEQERVFMLAHERAHQERRDTLVNLITAAWLCLFWFNPLIYWAVGRIRFDQEVACDALVVSRSEIGRKRYANALLKAQLTAESTWLTPVGCHWQSTHPLKVRIAMLKLPVASFPRRFVGIAFTVVLSAFGMYVVSTSFAQASPPVTTGASAAANASVSPDRKFAIDANDTDTREVLKMIALKGEHNILVSDQVTGKITLHLKDVTWREALEIVALSQGLVTKQSGNITLVAVGH